MQTKDYILVLFGICIGILIGWLIWHGEVKTETRQGQPQRQERPLIVHVTDSSGNVIPDTHTSFDLQVFPFENVYKFDNSTVTTNASVTVGMVDNKLSVGMVEAARSEEKIRAMSLWDMLVQYGGWAALAVYIIFKG